MGDSALVVRPADISEAAAIAELGRRHNVHWSGAPAGRLTPELIESNFNMPGTDPQNDFWSVDLDGRLVGCLMLWASEPYSEIEVVKYVDPDLGDPDGEWVRAALVKVALSAAAPYARRAADGVLPLAVLQVWPGEPISSTLRAQGFSYLRSTFTLVRSLAEPIVTLPLPHDVTVRPIDVDRDLADVVEVMTAFADHHGDLVLPAGQVGHFLKGPGGRPDLGRLAFDSEGPCSVVITEDGPDGGVVAVLATLARARGRGLGSALLHEAFSALRADGALVVRLMVDAENTTGALKLYLGAGMQQESAAEIWGRAV